MQGRFKRDGSASAEPEHGGNGPMAVGSSPQHAQNQNQGPSANGEGGGRPGRPGSAPPKPEGAPTVAPKTPKGPTGPGPRIALRNWRISTRLVSLLALPVVAATSLGGLRINQSMDDIQQLDNMKLLTDMTQEATELAAARPLGNHHNGGPPGPPRPAPRPPSPRGTWPRHDRWCWRGPSRRPAPACRA
ncbi:histidine kinase, partial [Streptomyces hirsutus]